MFLIKYLFKKLRKKIKSLFIFDLIFTERSEREANKIIHVIGDSHTSFFSGLGTKDNQIMQPEWPERSVNVFPFLKAYRIGAVTAYNSLNKIKTIKNILRFKSSNINKRDDVIMLCFGEIDVRAHLKKQAELRKINIDESVKICAERYFKTIFYIKEMGYNTAVWGIIASTPLTEISPEIPVIGDCKERNKITMLFNEYLLNLCKKNEIPFFSFFEDMIDENGLTKRDLLMDGHHLDSSFLPFIIEKFNKHGLI